MKKSFLNLLFWLSITTGALQADLSEMPFTRTNNFFLVEGDLDTITKPYLLPSKHPVKPILDAIFASGPVLKNEKTLAQAGFITLFSMPTSYVKVVKHPLAPGYVFKLYLESEKRLKFGKPGWIWLTNRCVGAKRIKALIKQKSIRHFCVADKWLYRVPGGVIQPVILVAKDMQLVSPDAIANAWKTQATKEHLKELYYILSQGCGSHFLTGNVPYTKWGKFAFIDTEYPKRRFTISNAGKYLSPDMKRYWDKLLKSKGKK